MFKTRDYGGATEADEAWVAEAGEQGRHGRRRESSGEPEWFHNLMTSEKAREIERSVGFDN